jgi:hypothetical protein
MALWENYGMETRWPGHVWIFIALGLLALLSNWVGIYLAYQQWQHPVAIASSQNSGTVNGSDRQVSPSPSSVAPFIISSASSIVGLGLLAFVAWTVRPRRVPPPSSASASIKHVGSPRVVPIRYAKLETTTSTRHFGILLANDGGDSAHDVQIETFTIGGPGGWHVKFDEVYRLGSNAQEMAAVSISGRNTALDLDWVLSQWLQDAIIRDNQTGNVIIPDPLPFNIVYRDHANSWYRSACELGRDALNFQRTYLRFIRQESIPAVERAAT